MKQSLPPICFQCMVAATMLMVLAGCHSFDARSQAINLPEYLTSSDSSGDFGKRPDIPDVDAIHRLRPEQLEDFLEYMNPPNYPEFKPNLRLYQYMNRVTRDFAYEGTTFLAEQTLQLNSGNCMSLAILATALARAAGVSMEHQLVDDVPVFEFNDTLVKKGVHIRTKLLNPGFSREEGGENRVVFTSPGIIIDFFPTNRQRFMGNLSEQEYFAMIYQNLAVEALEKDDKNRAYWLAREALQHAPQYSPAINTLAIINRRAGNLEVAERIYRYGITHADEKLTLMKNLAALLDLSGRTEEAEALYDQLDNMDDPSPFHWYQLAQDAANIGEYKRAIRYYNRSLEIAPYLHEAWLGKARVNYELGQLEKTRQALQEAYLVANKVSTQSLYEAKLTALSKIDGVEMQFQRQ